jgi:hypothetical protein
LTVLAGAGRRAVAARCIPALSYTRCHTKKPIGRCCAEKYRRAGLLRQPARRFIRATRTLGARVFRGGCSRVGTNSGDSGRRGCSGCKTRFRPSCGVANAAYRRVAFHLLHTHLLLTASDALHSRTSELVTEDAVVLSCWGMSVPNGSCPLFRNRQGSCSYSETDECTKR